MFETKTLQVNPLSIVFDMQHEDNAQLCMTFLNIKSEVLVHLSKSLKSGSFEKRTEIVSFDNFNLACSFVIQLQKDVVIDNNYILQDIIIERFYS